MAKDRFEGKIILVTGGNSGIGLATAQRLVSEGATVIITGRDHDKLQKAVKRLGEKAYGIVTDATKVSDIDSLFAQIKEKYGHLDGLFVNAGIATFIPLEQVTEQMVDALMDTNIKGTFFTVQKAIPLFVKGTSVVLTSSTAATKVRSNMTVYGATKAAVRLFAKGFSNELIPQGVRVNVVSPGPIETPIWEDAKVDQAAMEAVKAVNPSKRFGTPEEVAGAVAYLLSDESAYVVGAELIVDGGFTQL